LEKLRKLRENKGDGMRDVNKRLADVKEKLEQKIRHPYLLKNIGSPLIDEDKLLLLLAVLEQLNFPESKLEKYAVTTMLVQIALDTHELVSNEKLKPEHLKERQLTILAGTYYSALYYHILANLEDVKMIRSLATGIKNVNENKITVYQKDPEAVDTLMRSVRKIESSLFDRYTEQLDDPDWGEFAANFLFVKRLIAEKELFMKNQSSVVFSAMKKILYPSNHVNEPSIDQQNHLLIAYDKYLDHTIQLLQKYASKLPLMNGLLAQRTESIINQHRSAAITFVEEG
jgi:heptaprenyl diphosphate synthase